MAEYRGVGYGATRAEAEQNARADARRQYQDDRDFDAALGAATGLTFWLIQACMGYPKLAGSLFGTFIIRPVAALLIGLFTWYAGMLVFAAATQGVFYILMGEFIPAPGSANDTLGRNLAQLPAFLGALVICSGVAAFWARIVPVLGEYYEIGEGWVLDRVGPLAVPLYMAGMFCPTLLVLALAWRDAPEGVSVLTFLLTEPDWLAYAVFVAVQGGTIFARINSPQFAHRTWWGARRDTAAEPGANPLAKAGDPS
ncbi:hypothetical protein [Pseudoponticoccus marisrubri]|uniref:Uncharacterized protein n=1 Tax=Pseudoponticoccus marisrubri TaxID=1685382 RepID=A0A0W7WKX0_9RHOB|nr:hypothetical protein [Pseudoponticoccus marisrubri]KUF11261.1 hypothetical protein AVJ23_09445 [Pseudoponticoccus marisrubri]